MKTRIIRIKDDYGPLESAAELIKKGEIVAFPTETVYGLGASIYREDGIKKIFEVKGRPADNPLIVHIADLKQLGEITEEVPSEAEKLIKAFWPGPLTLIFRKKENISPLITAGLDTVAVRMPENETARELIRRSGVPIAAPSANISGRPSITRGDDLIDEFSSRVASFIIGEDSQFGIESTVLDLSGGEAKILRPGIISESEIQSVLKKEITEGTGESERPRSPGMKYKHYSPRGKVILFDGNDPKLKEKVDELKGRFPGSLLVVKYKTTALEAGLPTVEVSGTGDYTRRLYSILRDSDKEGFSGVLLEYPPPAQDNAGLIDRLNHAGDCKI